MPLTFSADERLRGARIKSRVDSGLKFVAGHDLGSFGPLHEYETPIQVSMLRLTSLPMCAVVRIRSGRGQRFRVLQLLLSSFARPSATVCSMCAQQAERYYSAQ